MSERDARTQLVELQERLDSREAAVANLKKQLQSRSDDLATQRAVNQQLMLKKEEVEWQLLAAIAQVRCAVSCLEPTCCLLPLCPSKCRLCIDESESSVLRAASHSVGWWLAALTWLDLSAAAHPPGWCCLRVSQAHQSTGVAGDQAASSNSSSSSFRSRRSSSSASGSPAQPLRCVCAAPAVSSAPLAGRAARGCAHPASSSRAACVGSRRSNHKRCSSCAAGGSSRSNC